MKSFESGYTGRLLESEILPRLSDDWRRGGYFNEERSFQWVRNHQLWNPSDPDNKIANELHYKIAEKLGLDNVNDLKLYSAINSPLDYHYGIDAFLEIGDIICTLDLSINPHKVVAKADIVVYENDLLEEKGLEELSETISNYIKKGGSRIIKMKAA